MKKSTKILLFGIGIAAVGFLAYAVLKKPEEPAAQPEKPAREETPSSTSTASKEFVEHRREVLREKSAAKAVSQDETTAAPAAEEVISDTTKQNGAGITEQPVAAENPTENDSEPADPVPASEDASEKPAEADEEQT